jgi:hypothetical protein
MTVDYFHRVFIVFVYIYPEMICIAIFDDEVVIEIFQPLRQTTYLPRLNKTITTPQSLYGKVIGCLQKTRYEDIDHPLKWFASRFSLSKWNFGTVLHTGIALSYSNLSSLHTKTGWSISFIWTFWWNRNCGNIGTFKMWKGVYRWWSSYRNISTFKTDHIFTKVLLSMYQLTGCHVGWFVYQKGSFVYLLLSWILLIFHSNQF